MSEPNTDSFNPGGLQDRVDNRDYAWSEVGGAARFDWNIGFDAEKNLQAAVQKPDFRILVKDQEQSSACGGFAWAYLAEVLEALNTGTYEPRSPKYVYAQTYQAGGGSTGRDNAAIFGSQGVCRENLLPSHPATEAFLTRGQDIMESQRDNAKFAKAFPYVSTGTNMDSIASAMSMNSGVILLVNGSNNGTWGSENPQPPATVGWRHWLLACKARMNQGVREIGVINSWGPNVGAGGWQWLSEKYFTSGNVLSGWTHVFSPPPPSPGFHHIFNTDLHLGMTGPEITALQTALQLESVFPITLPPTGNFGAITLAAVKAFQLKYQITPVSGFVGPLTRARLNLLYN